MRARTALAGVGLAGAVVCAWMLLRREPPRGEPSAEASPTPERARDDEGVAEKESELAVPATATRRVEERDAGAAVPALAHVLVVDGRNGAPLPGAVVRWIDINDPAVLPALQADSDASLQDLAETVGGRALADERGLAGLPLTDPFLVQARHGPLWNEAVSVRIGKEPLRLELFPDLLVDVVDGGGAPLAGVRLDLRVRDENGIHPRMALATGSDGRAAFSHREIQRERDVPVDVEVSFPFPLAEPIVLELRSDAIPEEPRRIVLPPTGRVVVELRGPDGRPYPGEASVALLTESESIDETFQERERQSRSGSVVHEHVGLDLDLVCRASLDPTEEWPSMTLEARARGPRSAGEETRIVLGPGIENPVLVGRVVDAQGRPVARASGRVTLRAADEDFELFPPELSPGWGLELETDALGGFRIPLPGGRVPPGERTLAFSFPDPAAAEVQAQVDLSGALEVGPTDLGDVVLGAAPLLASGRVVDDAGRPLTGATVWLATPGGVLANGEEVWVHIGEPPPAETDASGAFEIRGWTSGGALGIAGALQGHGAARTQRIALGARDLVLRLERLGSVAGELFLDARLPAECVTVTLYRESIEGVHPLEKQVRLPAAGETHSTFRWENLQPGARIVEVELASDPRPVLSIPLEVAPGGEARLAPLDLRGRLRVVEFRVLDGSGAPLDQAWIQALDPAGEARPTRRFDGGTPGRGGSARLVLARPIDVAVCAPWCGVERLEGVLEDRTVRLGSGYRVRLVLPRAVVPPEPPVVLCAQLQPLEPRDRVKRVADWFAFGPDGRAEGWVHEPGSYGLTWVVERRRADGSVASASSLRESSVVVLVEDRAEEQILELRFDAGPLTKALGGQ